jgi:hypothetical protein
MPKGLTIPPMNIKDLSTVQLLRIIDIKQQIGDLLNQLDSIGGTGPGPGRPKGKRRMSAAGRAAIAAAAKARWAKYRGKAVKKSKPAGKRRKMSAAARAKMAAVARERWKKAKAAGKKTL